ncbi:hypothetical protein BH23ACT12_BH23ACT12_12960 [soil metagenome]
MPTFEELDSLTSKQLHDKAARTALKRLDVGFFLDLLASVPAAEMVAGHREEANEDVVSLSKRLQDAVHADEGELADAMRPIYIDYLLRH